MKTRNLQEDGFALVITLALLGVLVLAVFALSVLVRVGTQTASSAGAQAQARQNALVGLSIAQAELQVSAGRDDVVSANSSIRGKSVVNPVLVGLWPRNITTATPTNWLVSGNFSPDVPHSINFSQVPEESSGVVTLLGEKTVVKTATGRKYARAKKIELPAVDGGARGGFAFWIGDEGTKASLNVPPSLAPKSAAGNPLIADPRGEAPAFDVASPNFPRAVSFGQFRFVAPGVALASRFHDFGPSSHWVIGDSLQVGLFNINTTSEDAWKAVLAAYDRARAAGTPALANRYSDLAERITGLISNRTLAGGKVRQGPFHSVDAFWASDIVQDALIDTGITDISQADIQVALSPMLAVRSDTFLIRSYGEACNPSDPSIIEATAYCEAIVQRTPEIIDSITGPMGRRFVVTYFRWLGPDDI